MINKKTKRRKKKMAVKMRLTRLGDKKAPFYRIVVADSRVARDAKYIDLVGTYNPIANPEEIKIDNAKAQDWIKKGAQPTETVRALLVKSGAIESKKSK
jgi:small subunit ribosomal protein S16